MRLARNPVWPAVALAVLVGADLAGAASDTAALLARIKAVGKMGQGNAEAAKAWKELVAQGPSALPEILQTLDENQQLSSNWLLPAVDAIVEKAKAARQPLPVEQLEKLLKQTGKPPAGRRTAYEVLCRLDPKTPERLLPTMLQDPSPDLRRDAVAAVVKEAEGLAKKGDKEGEKKAYLRAFQAACDPEQVDAIAKKLSELGEKVDIARHMGFVQQWHLVVPFDNGNEVGFGMAYPPEKGVDLKSVYKGKNGAEARWKGYVSTDPHGLVNLNALLDKLKGTVAYAYAEIDSPEERPIQVRAGSNNAVKVFLNGKLVLAHEEYHHGMRVDQFSGPALLKKGRNELLVKICQNEQTESWAQEWKFQVRLCDSTGVAVPFTQAPVKSELVPKEEPKDKKK
jgi:hypothetical protein